MANFLYLISQRHSDDFVMIPQVTRTKGHGTDTVCYWSGGFREPPAPRPRRHTEALQWQGSNPKQAPPLPLCQPCWQNAPKKSQIQLANTNVLVATSLREKNTCFSVKDAKIPWWSLIIQRFYLSNQRHKDTAKHRWLCTVQPYPNCLICTVSQVWPESHIACFAINYVEAAGKTLTMHIIFVKSWKTSTCLSTRGPCWSVAVPYDKTYANCLVSRIKLPVAMKCHQTLISKNLHQSSKPNESPSRQKSRNGYFLYSRCTNNVAVLAVLLFPFLTKV